MREENEFLELANLKGDDVTINNNGLVAWQLTNLEEANTIFQIKDWLCENFNIKVVRWDATKRDLVIQNGFEEIPSYIHQSSPDFLCLQEHTKRYFPLEQYSPSNVDFQIESRNVYGNGKTLVNYSNINIEHYNVQHLQKLAIEGMHIHA